MKNLYIVLVSIIVFIGAVITALSFGNNDANVLDDLGVQDLTTEELVIELDSRILDGNVYSSSITGEYLSVSTSNDSKEIEIPDGLFYLSFAPYIENTHTCGTHNLVTCRGELKNEEFSVLIEDTEGNVIYDDLMTSFDSGFVGIWLPSNMELSITVSQNGLSASESITTNQDSYTCLTTLQLK